MGEFDKNPEKMRFISREAEFIAHFREDETWGEELEEATTVDAIGTKLITLATQEISDDTYAALESLLVKFCREYPTHPATKQLKDLKEWNLDLTAKEHEQSLETILRRYNIQPRILKLLTQEQQDELFTQLNDVGADESEDIIVGTVAKKLFAEEEWDEYSLEKCLEMYKERIAALKRFPVDINKNFYLPLLAEDTSTFERQIKNHFKDESFTTITIIK